MKFYLKNNYIYIIVGILVLLLFSHAILSSVNFFEITFRALSEPDYIHNFFYNSDHSFAFSNLEPNLFNVWRVIFKEAMEFGFQFDVLVIFGASVMQILLPVFSLIGTYYFYREYNSILAMEAIRERTYRKLVIKRIIVNALKIAITLYLAYFVYMTLMNYFATGNLGASSRTLFGDILDPSFYVEHTYFYFLLEAFVTMFMMPLAYTVFAQAMVLVFEDFKKVILVPLTYYYGVTMIGYVMAALKMPFHVYFNPSLMMASGTYEFNTILMILINMLPLFIGIFIMIDRTRYVES